MCFHLADGTDESAVEAAVVDAEEVEDLAVVEVAALALGVLEVSLSDLLKHIWLLYLRVGLSWKG